MAENQNDKPLALITGASSGIGRALATALAGRGHRTVLVARRREALEKLAAELNEHASSTAWPLDLADLDSIGPAMAEIENQFGPVGILINNAGFNQYQTVLDMSSVDHAKIMTVNYYAPLYLMKAMLPGMLSRNSGHIINIASASTMFGPPGHGAYAAAKSALISLTQTLAVEHIKTDVHFSYVNPGLVKTEFFNDTYKPLQKQIEKHSISANYVARKIVKLIDKPRLELYIPRHFRALQWIKTFSPTLAMKLIAKNTNEK